MSANTFFSRYRPTTFVLYRLHCGRSTFLWQRAVAVIAGWLAGRVCKKKKNRKCLPTAWSINKFLLYLYNLQI